jgi:hypothetical protein
MRGSSFQTAIAIDDLADEIDDAVHLEEAARACSMQGTACPAGGT